jgi:hypothetical protein
MTAAALATGVAFVPTLASTQTPGVSQSVAPSQTPAPDAAAVRPPRGLARLAAQSRPRVDWQAVRIFQQRNRSDSLVADMSARFKPETVDAIDLPILLPDIAALRSNARLYAFGDFYSLSFKLPDAHVSLSGNGRPLRMAAARPAVMAKAEGDTALTVQRTVDGRVASWTRFGVLYTAEVTCDSPKALPCRDETFVRKLVEQHRGVMMGKNARRAAGLE